MRILSSLTNRIFLGSAVLAILTIAVAVYRFNIAVTAQAENELQAGARGGRHAARGEPRHAVRPLLARGPPHRGPVESQGGHGHGGSR